jgi:hypothetical protein
MDGKRTEITLEEALLRIDAFSESDYVYGDFSSGICRASTVIVVSEEAAGDRDKIDMFSAFMKVKRIKEVYHGMASVRGLASNDESAKIDAFLEYVSG